MTQCDDQLHFSFYFELLIDSFLAWKLPMYYNLWLTDSNLTIRPQFIQLGNFSNFSWWSGYGQLHCCCYCCCYWDIVVYIVVNCCVADLLDHTTTWTTTQTITTILICCFDLIIHTTITNLLLIRLHLPLPRRARIMGKNN